MSPERFRGQCDVRADVYALGVTLYELLTLTPAFASGDRLRLIEMVRQTEAASPRSVDPRIPRDLETIVMKAIDKDPKRRYQSADEMGEDLQRFVNDEPIKARRVGQVERFTRWCRHHPAVAGLLAAVLVLMAAGTAVSSWQAVAATRARDDLAAKNAELAAEQAKVQARFDTAVKAIETFHTGVSEDALLKNPEFKELRTKLLKQAAGFYGELERLLAGQTDATSRRALAAGYFQLAELTAKIGDPREAVGVHRKALAIRRELAAEPGADLETRLDVARSLEQMTRVMFYLNDYAGALKASEEMREVAEQIEALDPSDAVRFVRAKSLIRVGAAYTVTGKQAEEPEVTRKALTILQTLVDGNPANIEYQKELAGAHDNIGITFMEQGRPAEALEPFRQALAIRRKLAVANPTNIEFQQKLGWSHVGIAWALLNTGRPVEAREEYREALAIARKLVDAQPAVSEFQIDLARGHSDVAVTLLTAGMPAEALEEFRKAVAIAQKLADADLRNTFWTAQLAWFRNNMGRALDRQGRRPEAFAALNAALAVHQQLAESDPTNIFNSRTLGWSHGYRGGARVRAGQPAEAAADLRKALELWAKLRAPDIETQVERSRALALLAGLGGDAKAGVTADEAKAFADQSVAALAEVVKTGWALPSELREPDFDALRGRADFRKLVAEVKAKAEKVPATAPPQGK
jgi:tetratricopeptide (TPR) repeat protein